MYSELGPNWEKADRSGPNDNCVEVRFVDGLVEVCDDKDPDSPTLKFTSAEWLAFTGSVRDGQFNVPG